MKNQTFTLPGALALGLLLAIGLAFASGGARADFAAPHGDEIRASIQATRNDTVPPPGWIARAKRAWDRKCGQVRLAKDGSSPTCLLTECEIQPRGCRKNRVVLFRGEAGRYDLPAVASLVRTEARGSRYEASRSAVNWLEQLARDIALFRPFEAAPDGEDVILVRDSAGDASRWIYSWDSDNLDEANVFGPSLTTKDPATLLGTVFAMHANWSYLNYRDPAIGDVDLDPLVSFTADPSIAFAFAESEEKSPRTGRTLVLSVPRRDLVTDCGESFPAPGSILDSRRCANAGEHADEQELDAILYAKPSYIWKSFRMAPGATRMRGN